MRTKISILSILFILFISITSCKKKEENANIKYDGKWTLTETCSPSGADNYPVTISLDSMNQLKFTIKTLWREPTSIICTIDSGNKNIFSATRQALTPSFDIEISSSNINTTGDIITINYKIYVIGSLTVVDACTATLKAIK